MRMCSEQAISRNALVGVALMLALCGFAAACVGATATDSAVLATTPVAPAQQIFPATTAPASVPTSHAVTQPDDGCGTAPAPRDAVVSDSLHAALGEALAHPGFADVELSFVVETLAGERVVANNPDEMLFPASNQKVFTALGAALLLGADERFRTTVFRDVDERLVLVVEGDPTLTSRGTHSLAALAAEVRAGGTTAATGLIVDASSFEATTTAPGWLDWQMPTYVGPMSAFMVGDNQHRSDDAYVADPASGNAALFVRELEAVGVRVAGETSVRHIAADPSGSSHHGEPLAVLHSAPVHELVATMLRSSDNETAESLVRRMGGGSTAEGTAAITEALSAWCLELLGSAADGSGLSRGNRRSATEWVALLRTARAMPWGEDFASMLPVAGRSGTLSRRLTSVAGAVSAKTGSIIGGRALSGFAHGDSGAAYVFSVVTNGAAENAAASLPAIDALITALVRHG